ncbi:protein kinase [Luteolibacter pohnpeiensis]|uniref:Protein kinase n=1 Tax=Luteolibacter pohnpeiensis TaxID=454153 RepID=A0A934S0S2_9BACT|nr:serine/threonine-protein kinase [Luteolibacter pohnpeiensis]MBK1881140.1 protein kinase [Luteolibacter pohnpeiensis]
MEDRYEIRGQIGQGGLGSVYRAFDKKMNREVALKRITPNDDAQQLSSATEQLSKEAGALASLQHPHIVTIYDVGSDDEGPYVVMELISGKTLDELVEIAPLTWPDFRELAMQTQEALIAAQELDLVHRDIKPGNLMLKWLPSGKFQVKIVDFGLAQLMPEPTLQDVDENDAVLGSIFFMAPEQFERGFIDGRTDLYAMGSVYYYALTGLHPFDGQTGQEVMAAHLNHSVTPLQQLRPDLPNWVCDWVMWLLNRKPDDRPATARDSLKLFLMNDAQQGPPTSSLRPPSDRTDPASGKTVPSPQPLLPPEGSQPSVHTTPVTLSASDLPTQRMTPGPTTRLAPTPVRRPPSRPLPPRPKPGMSNVQKTVIGVLALVVICVAVLFISKANTRHQQAEILDQLLEKGSEPGTRELPVTESEIGILLRATLETSDNTRLQKIYRDLLIATPKNAADLDKRIAIFAGEPDLPDKVRETLIGEILRQRGKPSAVQPLLDYVSKTNDGAFANMALETARALATQRQWEDFLQLLLYTTSDEIRETSEAAITELILAAPLRDTFGEKLVAAYQGAVDANVRLALIRLMGHAGGSQPGHKIREILKSGTDPEKAAAAISVGVWPDDSMFLPLVDTLKSTTNTGLRTSLFDSAFRLLLDPTHSRKPEQDEQFWKLLAANAETSLEQDQLVRSITTNRNEAWVADVLKTIISNGKSEAVITRAQKALDAMSGN